MGMFLETLKKLHPLKGLEYCRIHAFLSPLNSESSPLSHTHTHTHTQTHTRSYGVVL